MNDLKNSETVKNLMRAFAGESQARNRYTIAARRKKRDFLSSRPYFPIQQARRKSMQRFFIIISRI